MESSLNDRTTIPEEIKTMTSEQRLERIAQLEKEAAAEKKRLLSNADYVNKVM